MISKFFTRQIQELWWEARAAGLPPRFADWSTGFVSFLALLRSALAGRSWLRSLVVGAIACLVLTGCVDYDVSVRFQSPHAGEIVQHVKLSDRLTVFSSTTAQQWLETLEQRTRQLKGKTERLAPQELVMRVPFTTGQDFVQTFNQLFAAPLQSAGVEPGDLGDAGDVGTQEAAPLDSVSTQVQVRQSNFLLAVRHVLMLDADLRSLQVVAGDGNLVVSPGVLWNLGFALDVPGQVRDRTSPVDPNAPTLQETSEGHAAWTLKPGKINHLEVVFWLPSPLGWGALLITGFVALGIKLKERFGT